MCYPDLINRTGATSTPSSQDTNALRADGNQHRSMSAHNPQSGCYAESTSLSSSEAAYPPSNSTEPRTAMSGDVCTIELDLKANHGFVPEPLFDASGRLSFVLDHGNYLPAIHELVQGSTNTTLLRNIDIDAGYGAYRQDLVLTGVPLHKLRELHDSDDSNENTPLREGDTIYLGQQPPVSALVTYIDNDTHTSRTATLDLNPPLAGSSYNCRFLRVIDIAPSPWSSTSTTTNTAVDSTPFQVATLALGCFWGAELFGMRIPGVVGTRAGYMMTNKGGGKTEAVQVLFDTRVVSYEQLVRRAVDRSKEVRESVVWGGDWLWQQEEQQDDAKYRHGVYCHTTRQLQTAQLVLGEKPQDNNMSLHQYVPVDAFQVADPDQQQHLYKGGQSARKNAKDPIRCFG